MFDCQFVEWSLLAARRDGCNRPVPLASPCRHVFEAYGVIEAFYVPSEPQLHYITIAYEDEVSAKAALEALDETIVPICGTRPLSLKYTGKKKDKVG